MIIDIVKVFIPPILSFGLGILLTPVLTKFLYKNKMWKKKAGKDIGLGGGGTPIFNKLHEQKEVGTPRMGGIIIWLSVFITILGCWTLAHFLPNVTTQKLDLLSRNQTWIPFFTLIVGALVGLVDDYLEIKGSKDNAAGGLSLTKRLVVVTLIGLSCALWFYFKLDVRSIGLPTFFGGMLNIGWLFIPFFVLVMLAVYSGGVIDGLDGLSGGIFATMFASYAGIAFYQQQINLAAFCAVIVGAILAFLWYNIPPARFYMSETGSMALTVTLTVVAFMTDSLGHGYGVLVLPIIGFPLLITSLSVIIQVLSKKLRQGKKVFLVAPIHHHFEALGWPAYKVVMRYWVIGVIFAMLGLVLALLG
jgi:phospho-N-acetylmuramoyl-pentapeptide-transferase